MSNTIPFPHNSNVQDRITHVSIAEGEVTALVIEAIKTVSQAQRIHGTSPVATAALGRTLIGTAMIGSRLKGDNASVTVSVNGGGPIGKITTVAQGTKVKGYVSHPGVNVEQRPDGKLNVGAAVGHDGALTVVKDLGLKSPYVGQTELISGELGEDFAQYFMQSEQQPSIVSLGVLVNGSNVLSAGGILVTPMPGCPQEIINQLEIRTMMMADISHDLLMNNIEDNLNNWFGGMNPKILATESLEYKCNCSRERMEKAIIALGEIEMRDMINTEEKGIEMTCHFCGRIHNFSKQDLVSLLEMSKK